MGQEEREEAIERLGEIRVEMEELLDEALRIVRSLDEKEHRRASAYWYAQIKMALSDDHEYLGSGSHTLQDAIEAMWREQEDRS